MGKDKCENCGRFLGSYSAEANADYQGIKKGDTIEIYGCKHCEKFTLEGHKPKEE